MEVGESRGEETGEPKLASEVSLESSILWSRWLVESERLDSRMAPEERFPEKGFRELKASESEADVSSQGHKNGEPNQEIKSVN